jgi:hypothetical protein
MVHSESVKDILKQQTLKEPKFTQLNKLLYQWLTAVRSEGKPMTGPMIIGKAKSFYGEMKITDKCTSIKNYL